jgi:hypothetical protein
VAHAIEQHILTLTTKLLNSQNILSDVLLPLLDSIKECIYREISKQTRLQKVHLRYPKAGWNIKTRLERLEDETYTVNAEVELDLERNVRLNLQFGESGKGVVVASMEEEKIPTNIPDRDRQQFDLKIEADYINPDGSTGKVDVAELRRERRSARSVDIGGAAPIKVEEIVVLPRDIPEIEIDDVVASPPIIEPEPSRPESPVKNPMSSVKPLKVKFR